jgi:hypothetical protein
MSAPSDAMVPMDRGGQISRVFRTKLPVRDHDQGRMSRLSRVTRGFQTGYKVVSMRPAEGSSEASSAFLTGTFPETVSHIYNVWRVQ